MSILPIPDPSTSIPREDQADEPGAKRGLAFGLGGVACALVDAACLFSIVLKGVAAWLGLGTLTLAGFASFLHTTPARIPLISLAVTGAAANLYVAWMGWRLRRAPAAQWRTRALSRRERRTLAVALSASALTFVIIGLESWAHRILHP